MTKSKIWNYESNENDALAKKVEKDNDIVMTSPLMAIDLIARIPFQDGDIVMEPCKGSGSFYDNLPNNTTNLFCEINEGIDYLKFEGEVDYTISNPPFVPRKLFWDFHCKAMETTRQAIYWLINLSSLNAFTPKRLNEMSKDGWYLNNFHIVNDKRWYGRYVRVRFSRTSTETITWCEKYTKKY